MTHLRNWRPITFALVCAGSVVAVGGYAMMSRGTPGNATSATRAVMVDGEAIRAATAGPHLVFRNTSLEHGYGHLALVPLSDVSSPRVLTPMQCERVHFAAGTGVCLAAARGVLTSYRLELFGSDYEPHHTVPLGGLPSRARVAPAGDVAALTYFVSGDSYAATGFSTRTFLIDPAQGDTMINLEDFAVTRDGARFASVDFNFWGITFAPEPHRFYATLASGGTMYLVEGRADTRTARVLRAGVECPSLSPNGRRIAFKKRQPGIGMHWRIAVLDLVSAQEWLLPETRSVDDQIEWLDDDTVLYGLPASGTASMHVWAAAADGSGAPRLFLENAESPAVVRMPLTR